MHVVLGVEPRAFTRTTPHIIFIVLFWDGIHIQLSRLGFNMSPHTLTSQSFGIANVYHLVQFKYYVLFCNYLASLSHLTLVCEATELLGSVNTTWKLTQGTLWVSSSLAYYTSIYWGFMWKIVLLKCLIYLPFHLGGKIHSSTGSIIH